MVPVLLSCCLFLLLSGCSKEVSEKPSASIEKAPVSLASIEEEIAKRYDTKTPFERDGMLVMSLVDQARTVGDYPPKLWLALFAPSTTNLIPEKLRPDDRDRRAARYLSEVLDPAWSLRVAELAREFEKVPRRKPIPSILERGNSPQVLSEAFDRSVEVWGPNSQPQPWTGVHHLISGCHATLRGHWLAQDAIIAAGWHFEKGFEGRDVVDIGTGCGPTLSEYRQAMGPKGRLYAQDIDPFALHTVQHLWSDLDLKMVLGSILDLKLPPESVDIAVMTGVHFGSGLGQLYEPTTLPWLRSVAKALRKDGILIIDEGNLEYLDQNMTEKVERAGFRQLKLVRGDEHPRKIKDFLVVFVKK